MKDEITIIVHGFNKDKHDMGFMKQGLCDSGFKTVLVDLPTTFGTIEDCKNSLDAQINNLIKKYRVVNYVGHSMGGLIIRAYINDTKQNNVEKCVFIATPHRGSRLADIANRIPFYAKIFRPIESLLSGSNLFPPTLDQNIKVGLIAGNKNTGFLGKLFLTNESDGRVEVASVEFKDADEFIVLPFGHQKIHHQHKTLILVKNFLLQGTFANTN
ncbi:MAG: alpha/beta hydrolase [Deltaproteobacteria bacterium]|nr:alpha/beta hydrolase [Deltaproteobacteria bacterium]